MNEEEIFSAALEIDDPQQRLEYLDRVCEGAPERRRQLDLLCAAHEQSGEFLDRPALRQMSGNEKDSPTKIDFGRSTRDQTDQIDLSFLEPPTGPDSIGRLGHYSIREVIGRGGCGIVLRALDEKLERMVAIKVMDPVLAITSPARQRFLREARGNAAVQHENVVGIFAVEEQPLPYLVMELVDGQTLQEKSDGTGPLAVREILRIGHQMASGLAAAHAQKLIHRDIKPANTLLECGAGRIKITDFGLARAVDDASVTQSGVIAGTPMYMSPEQAQGFDIDQRSDLFSLGSVLYLLCCGRPPFRANSSFAVLRRVIEEQPRAIREILPEIPDWLAAMVNKLQAKLPDHRYATASEVAELFEACLADIDRLGGCELSPEVRAKIMVPVAEENIDGVSSDTRRRQQVGTNAPTADPAIGPRPLGRVFLAGLAVLAVTVSLLFVLGHLEFAGWSRSLASVLPVPSVASVSSQVETVPTLPENPFLSELPASTAEMAVPNTDSQPETSAPETSAPETSAPEISAPETSAPETSAPETSAPETSAPETSAPETSAPGRLVPDSVWLGERTYREGAFAVKTVHYELHIREVDGATFRGHVFDNGRGRNFAVVEGQFEADQLQWTEKKQRGDQMTVRATFNEGKLKMVFTGVYPGGARNRGDGELVLVAAPDHSEGAPNPIPK